MLLAERSKVRLEKMVLLLLLPSCIPWYVGEIRRLEHQSFAVPRNTYEHNTQSSYGEIVLKNYNSLSLGTRKQIPCMLLAIETN